MAIFQDFKELLELFNAHGVEYVIVGGHALAFHGSVRATKDLDLLVRPTRENAERVMRALDAFGFGKTGLTHEDFEKPGQIIQLGFPPVRIDIVTSIEAVPWDEVAAGQSPGEFAGLSAHFLGRAQLIANKKAVGRLQDLADVEALGEDPERAPKAHQDKSPDQGARGIGKTKQE